MKKVCIALLTFISIQGFSQSLVSARLTGGYDLGMAYNTDRYHPSFSYYQLINIGPRKIVSLGWTLRLGAFYGNNINYYTAPAPLTRGKAGFSALGAPLLVENIDTVSYDHVTMTSLNVGVRAQINLGRVDLGASADLLGLTLGRSRTGRYQSSTGKFAIPSSTGGDSLLVAYQGSNLLQQASPSLFNLRLLGDNDIGTLATEVYARIHLTQRIAVKLGYQWLITETTVKNRDVVADNARFRNRSGMAYLAVTFPIFY